MVTNLAEIIRVDKKISAHIRSNLKNLGWPGIRGPRDVYMTMKENSMDMNSKN